MHKYIICIGSNYERNKNLSFARQQLRQFFPSVVFTPEKETVPLQIGNPALFSNQIGIFFSKQNEEEIQKDLKEIEIIAGRHPEDKQKERICLDIDLLACDNQLLKPEDCKREYVKELLSLLPSSLIHHNDMKYIGIIPARYASTRFPGKPLALLSGKPVIQHVYEQVAGMLDDAYVATDDERIEAVVKNFGGKAIMTSVNHKSGTDRCYEAFTKIDKPFDIVINIQGDEPFIQPSQLNVLKHCFDDSTTQIATLVKPFTSKDSFAALENVNSPKVVVNNNWNALYFSRSIIPYQRNAEKQGWLKNHTYYKHIGLYAYRSEVLKEITALPQSPLEIAESLEQLRWLENGYKIKVGISDVETIGIDTPQDLVHAEEFLKNRR